MVTDQSFYSHVCISQLLGVALEGFLAHPILVDPLNIGVLHGSDLRHYLIFSYALPCIIPFSLRVLNNILVLLTSKFLPVLPCQACISLISISYFMGILDMSLKLYSSNTSHTCFIFLSSPYK